MTKLHITAFLLLALAKVWAIQEISIASISEEPSHSIDAPKYLKQLPEAVKLAVAKRAEEFKRLGLKITVKPYYAQGSKPASYGVMQEVLQGPTVAAVGIQSSDEGAVMAPALSGTDFLVVSPFATSTELLRYQPNFLQLPASNEELAKTLESFMTNTRAKNVVAIVAWDSAYSQNFYKSLSQKMKQRIQLIKIQESLPNLEAITKLALSFNPQVILLPNFPVCSATLIRSLTQRDYRGVFLGGDTWGEGADPRFLKITGDLLFSGFTIRQFFRGKRSEEEQKLASALATTGVDYSVVSALYYDATNYLLNLIKSSPEISRFQILETSKTNRTHKGVTGFHCFSSGQCRNRGFKVVHVDRNGFHFQGEIKRGQIETK